MNDDDPYRPEFSAAEVAGYLLALTGHFIDAIPWPTRDGGFSSPVRVRGTVVRVERTGWGVMCFVGEEESYVYFPRSMFESATIVPVERERGGWALKIYFRPPLGVLDIEDARIQFAEGRFVVPGIT